MPHCRTLVGEKPSLGGDTLLLPPPPLLLLELVVGISWSPPPDGMAIDRWVAVLRLLLSLASTWKVAAAAVVMAVTVAVAVAVAVAVEVMGALVAPGPASTGFLERLRPRCMWRSQYFWSGTTSREHRHFLPSVLRHRPGSGSMLFL